MFDMNAKIIINALVDKIKDLRCELIIKNSKIEKLEEQLKEKEAANG